MLNLSASPRVVAGVTVAADTAGPGRWFVLPPPARLRVDPSSGPDVSLLRFVDGGALSGGFLRLGIELSVPETALAAATAALTEENGGKPVTLSPLPLVAAEADLVFFGKDPAPPGGESPLVARHYGISLLDVNPPHRGVFAVRLTAEGVRLVESGLRSGAVPVGVVCRLTAEGLWPSARVTARVDWHSAYDHFSSEYKVGALLVGEDVKHLMQHLEQSQAVVVTAVQSPVPGSDPAGVAGAVQAALTFIQDELLGAFCQPLLPLRTDPAQASLGTAGELLDLGSAYEVKALREVEDAVGSYDFQQATVARRVLPSQADLSDLLRGLEPASVIVDATPDNPFFAQFHLDVRTARALADSHLAEVVLDVAYGTASGSIRLTPDAPSGGFDSFADASQDGSWHLTPRVTFGADSPVDAGALLTLPTVAGSTRDITLDLERALGLRRLDLEGTTDPRVLATELTVTSSTGSSQGLDLAPAQPTGTVWFRGQGASDLLTVTGRHLLADGRQVPVGPLAADTALCRLPDPFVGTITVQVVTDAVWTDLTHLDVAIQKDTSSPTKTFAFTAPASAAVALDQLDPTDRTYRYKVSRVVGGLTTEDPWLVSDLPLLQAGVATAGELVVDVEPIGPELPTAGLRVVQVDLLYVDAAHQLRAEHTHVISAKSDSYHWLVALTDPTLRSYQYRITKTLLVGGEVSTGWLDSSDPLLTVALTAS